MILDKRMSLEWDLDSVRADLARLVDRPAPWSESTRLELERLWTNESLILAAIARLP